MAGWNGLVALLLIGGVPACTCSRRDGPTGNNDAAAATGSAEAAKPRVMAERREGGALVRGVTEPVLYLADEDHKVVRTIRLPVDINDKPRETPVPGPPAQVLALDGMLLCTIRDPGLLLMFSTEGGALREVGRVELPADAWGIAVTPDEKTALVTSAWARQVSAVDLETKKLRFSVEVPREPRGIVALSDRAYVSHLTSADLTRIDGISGKPSVKSVSLPAAPARTPYGEKLGASLGYALIASPDGKRVFAARHALGAVGLAAWFGASSVDVLATANDQPLAGPRQAPDLAFLSEIGKPLAKTGYAGIRPIDPDFGAIATTDPNAFVQPRAMVYRKRTHTLLVAAEGNDSVVELDARAVDPGAKPLEVYKVGSKYPATLPLAERCGAPSGIALSEDENMAWVFCRSTYDLGILVLDQFDGKFTVNPVPVVHLADDPLPHDAAMGRKIFYNATDEITSGGLACAGCHPEGRDDAHVWHEFEKPNVFLAESNEAKVLKAEPARGYPRQTPMLAGRVASKGPFGWHGNEKDIAARLMHSFRLHRWGDSISGQPWDSLAGPLAARAGYIAAFVRTGLVPPPRSKAKLSEVEERGRTLFGSKDVGCSACHVPENEYTDRERHSVPLSNPRSGFDPDPDGQFRTPSLFFVGGSAPYFHDGSAATLEQLIDSDDDRMGRVKQLSRADRDALIAYLRTL
jgi:cytochrome c peroxidase